MPLYEKFGLDAQLFAKKHFKEIQEDILVDITYKPINADLVSTYKSSSVLDSNRICIYYYLAEEKVCIGHYAHPILDYALEYFFGEWRAVAHRDGKTGCDVWKKSLWLAEYRNSILWAIVLSEWDKAKEISKYPDKLCMEADFESKEKKAWYILLAIYLREDDLENASHYVALIETGKKKREKLLLNVIRTIIAKNSRAFEKEFLVYMNFYKSHEFPQKQVTEKLAIDGTIMFNLAKHKGLQVHFPDKYIDHYIHLD